MKKIGSNDSDESAAAAHSTSVRNIPVGKSLQRNYTRSLISVSHCGEVLPQTPPQATRVDFEASKLFATWGRKAKMALGLQVVSSHFFGVRDTTGALSSQSALVDRVLPYAVSEADAVKCSHFPRMFLLDGCSLAGPLGPLSGRLRRDSPGSKFLALVAPERSDIDEMIRLFRWGIDGVVVLDEDWRPELPKASLALLRNRVWAPLEVLLAFVKHIKTLLDRRLLSGESLTTRESQALRLLFPRLTNKKIVCALKISEGTARFHVCKVLNELGLESRRGLAETLGLETV